MSHNAITPGSVVRAIGIIWLLKWVARIVVLALIVLVCVMINKYAYNSPADKAEQAWLKCEKARKYGDPGCGPRPVAPPKR